MNWQDWYTDTMSVYRVREVLDGNLTRHERALVSGNIPLPHLPERQQDR